MSAPCRNGRAPTRRRLFDLPLACHQSRGLSHAVAARGRAGQRALGRVEQVKSFRILDRELDPEVEGEAVTATRKIKRSLLQQHFSHLIRRDVRGRRGTSGSRANCTERITREDGMSRNGTNAVRYRLTCWPSPPAGLIGAIGPIGLSRSAFPAPLPDPASPNYAPNIEGLRIYCGRSTIAAASMAARSI